MGNKTKEQIEYLNIEFNPEMKPLASVLADVGDWEFIDVIAINPYSSVAKFSRLKQKPND